MKVNPILQDIYKGQWLLDAHSVTSFAPIIAKILEGKEVLFQKTDASLLGFTDKNGKNLKADDDGVVEITPGSVAHIDMNGPIVKRGGLCSYGADDIVRALRIANGNKNVKGIVLHIDGPGGSVNAIGPFLQFAKEKSKPVIGLIDSAYSAHYWAAVAVCDVLLADNDVSFGVGSVGVVFSFMDTKPVLEAKGYVFHDIYPDESKHKNEAFHLARAGEYDMIKAEMLAPMARKFQSAVKQGRPGLIEATGVLTGKTFDYEKAREYKMVDGLASVTGAIEQLDLLIELKNFANK